MASAAAESGGSVAGGRCGEGKPEWPAPQPQQKMSPMTPERAAPRQGAGACFTCRQEGHWSRDCPSKRSPGRTPPGGGGGGGGGGGVVEVPECTCGAGPALVLVSKTEKNPGRMFFSCPAVLRCDFFQWCDSPNPCRALVANPVQQHLNLGSPIQLPVGNTPQQGDVHPLCQCGAGWCIVLTANEGEYAGRKYFACPMKKSDERCDFRRWCDESNLSGKCTARPMRQDIVSPSHGTANILYPNCTCGAGRCRLLTKETGEYAGRKYFACPVKKGQGACNFFQWQNDAEGGYENGSNHLFRSKNQHPDLVMEEPRAAKPFNLQPTSLNFDNVVVGESNAGMGKAHTPSFLGQRQGDGEGSSDQSGLPMLHNSSSNVSFKPGKCYKCGKEGHWMADCVESRLLTGGKMGGQA